MTGSSILASDRLSSAFTPTRPIDLPDFLAGRKDLIFRIQDAIYTPGKHILLYGNRGVGKTSIARVLAYVAQEVHEPDGLRSIMVSCDSTDTFGTIWRKVFQEVLLAERQLGFEAHRDRSISGRLDPDQPINSPNDVRLLISMLPNPTIIVVDEFDRIPAGDGSTGQLMTDTIKLFADTNTKSTLLFVGVGQTIEELVTAHDSISRNMDYVPVEPMGPEELAGIIRNGFSSAALNYENGLDFRIAQLSQGYPHYTHLLGLWSGRMAVQRESDTVTLEDLRSAIPAALRNPAGGIQVEYDQATDSTHPDALYRPVLLACALADKDVRGRFGSSALRAPLGQILERPNVRPVVYQRHLAQFCESDRGPVLVRTGKRKNYRWQFANPQLIPFVRLRGIEDGLISE